MSENTVDIIAKQKAEALARMKKLNLHPNAIKEFAEEGKLNLSRRGILFWLDEDEQKMVKKFEEKTGNLVYHVILNQMEFGLCYSLLYVSPREEEWESDRKDLNEKYPFAFVVNADVPEFSEYGTIGIKPMFGGVLRTA